jgi:hypothetical protein
MALHCEKRVKNANNMERKLCVSQNNHSILQQYIYASLETSPKNEMPSHHGNIDGEFLTIAQYNLHMGNFAKYEIVVQTCTQQVVGGVVSLFQSFDFIKVKVKKHLSSSMLPTICTIANSISFTYFRKLKESTQNVVTSHHILVKGFKSKGGATHIVAFDFIVNLNMPC